MRTTDLHASSSIAALTAAFPCGPRIAFAPDTGAGGAAQGSGKPIAARKDATRKDDAEGAPPTGGDKLDKLLTMMQAIQENQEATGARLDALEGKGKEGADELTEAEKEQIAKADGIGAEMDAIRDRMPLSTRQAAEKAKEDALSKVQVRADSAFNLHGRRAPAPLAGETVMAYRVRVLRDHQKFSEAFKGVDLNALAKAGDATFAPVEDRIYADSEVASHRPEGPADGGLMLRERFDRDMQRNVKEYFGRNSYAKLMSPVAQRFAGFKVEPRQY